MILKKIIIFSYRNSKLNKIYFNQINFSLYTCNYANIQWIRTQQSPHALLIFFKKQIELRNSWRNARTKQQEFARYAVMYRFNLHYYRNWRANRVKCETRMNVQWRSSEAWLMEFEASVNALIAQKPESVVSLYRFKKLFDSLSGL